MEELESILEDICESRGKYPHILLNFVEEHLIYCPSTVKEQVNLERLFHCTIDLRKEKHHELQYTYYYTITSDLVKGELHIEIESGIESGTNVLNVSTSGSLRPQSRTVEVMTDVALDEKRVKEMGYSVLKAQAVFPHYKNEIIDLIRKQGYDNYVTGGGTNKTDRYYKNRFDEIRSMGLYWKCIYEEIEADINWV